MNLFALVRIQFSAMFTELRRVPAFVIPTIGLPGLFFVLFGVPSAHTTEIANLEMASFVAFAIIGVTLFQFGVGVAQDRALPWERYVRTLAAPVAVRFAARVLCAFIFGFAAAAIVVVLAIFLTPVHLAPLQWVELALYAIIGGIPFILFGIAIGYWCVPKAAVPIANVFYLLLSFAGGLWIPPQYLPHPAQLLSPYTPTRQFGDLLWGVNFGASPLHPLLALLIFAAIFAAIASIGYRRDEKQRYG